MKKTTLSQSLFNLRRNTLANITVPDKDVAPKEKRQKISSSIVKSINLAPNYQNNSQALLENPKKNDIQQIYEYKIKERARSSKFLQKQRQLQQQKSPQLKNIQKCQQIQLLRLENQKMSKQLADLSKQNSKLKDLVLVINENKTKNRTENGKKEAKDYKREMLNKLNARNRLKTEKSGGNTKNYDKQQPVNLNTNEANQQKKSKSKRKNNSKNSITMNLNMSFIKMKSPSCSKIKSPSFSKTNSVFQNQKYFSKLISSKSMNPLLQKQKSLKVSRFQPKEDVDIKSLFDDILEKKTICVQDLQQFYKLSKKIFAEFNEIIVYSKRAYSEIIQKINYSSYCHKNELQQSKELKRDGSTIHQTLRNIQELYKKYSPQDLYYKHPTQYSDCKKVQIGSKLNTQGNQQKQTPSSSSAISVNEVFNNPQRQKSYQKYRLNKLNQNLDLLSNFQNKKLKTDASQDKTTQPKVYFSKPVSTNISRKISFNNSLNNSLKNSKLRE